MDGRSPAHPTRVASDLQNLTFFVTLFETRRGSLLTEEEGLAALVVVPGEKPRARILPELPTDPWGHPYRFIRRPVIVWKDGVPTTENGFGLYSCGPDGISKSAGYDPDDIRSW
jgi:general secretion pathway protein G